MKEKTKDFLAGLIVLTTIALVIYGSCLGITKILEVIL